MKDYLLSLSSSGHLVKVKLKGKNLYIATENPIELSDLISLDKLYSKSIWQSNDLNEARSKLLNDNLSNILYKIETRGDQIISISVVFAKPHLINLVGSA